MRWFIENPNCDLEVKVKKLFFSNHVEKAHKANWQKIHSQDRTLKTMFLKGPLLRPIFDLSFHLKVTIWILTPKIKNFEGVVTQKRVGLYLF